MVQVLQTETFEKWLRKLSDRDAKARIQVRIDRMALGNFGDVKPVGQGVSEMRIDYGPGYRVYFKQKGQILVILLCGGTKDGQQDDIKRAQQIAKGV